MNLIELETKILSNYYNLCLSVFIIFGMAELIFVSIFIFI